MGRSHWVMVLAGALTLASCGGGAERAARGRDTGGMTGQMDSGGMDMAGMQMQGMTEMRAHMDSMMRMSPGQVQDAMAAHQMMLSQMLDRMGADMRTMKMSGTPEWDALTDSVKQDLAELPDLEGKKLSDRVRGHAGRVERLLGMHEGMMTK